MPYALWPARARYSSTKASKAGPRGRRPGTTSHVAALTSWMCTFGSSTIAERSFAAPPVEVQGRKTHQVGLPYHWGTRGLTTGGSANDLTGVVLDPNVHIQEVKAFSVGIKPGRWPRGADLPEFVERIRREADGDVR